MTSSVRLSPERLRVGLEVIDEILRRLWFSRDSLCSLLPGSRRDLRDVNNALVLVELAAQLLDEVILLPQAVLQIHYPVLHRSTHVLQLRQASHLQCR